MGEVGSLIGHAATVEVARAGAETRTDNAQATQRTRSTQYQQRVGTDDTATPEAQNTPHTNSHESLASWAPRALAHLVTAWAGWAGREKRGRCWRSSAAVAPMWGVLGIGAGGRSQREHTKHAT